MEIGLIRKIDIDQEMQQAYLDYAMSVIVARALPDARDGLKPVHRRILYAMHDMGLRTNSTYKKSARVVGEVLGKYHPHSDSAVYDAMARMAQDFSMRYPLVDGQGNFGSVDGDPPAAMRYTEARMATFATGMLEDINKDTVEFIGNFDATLNEPTVLPAAIPNMLVNGSTGIAVGMSTSIPPHNLGEVIDALDYMLSKWSKLDDISVQDLMQFIQGPDFPTGGLIIQDAGDERLTSAYGSGRGRITVQARAHVEEMGRSRSRIIVTELPYLTNKSSLIGRIASLVRDGKIEGISDLRDETDRQGMRIVIELSRNADPETILRALYRRTPMQSTFSIIMLALVDGEPRLLSLKQSLRVYLEHRLEIVRRRSEYELKRARQRSHLLEGLRVALQNLDEVINLIRKAPDVPAAHSRLMRRFKLSEIQAQAILDMPLRRLAALERKKIEQEYKEVQRTIKGLEGLLKSPLKMRRTVSGELMAIKESFQDRRRTQIVNLEKGVAITSTLTADTLTPAQQVWVAVTPDGLISRSLENKQPRPSGRGAPGWLLRANTRDTLYLVAEDGEAAALAVHALPEAEKITDGVPLTQASPLTSRSKLASIFSLPPRDQLAPDWFVVTASRGGMVKKSPLEDLPGPAAQTFTLAKVKEGDRLGWVRLSDGSQDILFATAQGMAIRFTEEEVRPMGLVASGVMGMKLKVGDELVGMEVLPDAGEVFLLADSGQAKRVRFTQFSAQGRYGQGIIGWKLPEGVRLVGMAIGKPNARATIHLAKAAAKASRLDAAPIRTRPSRGKALLEVKAKDRVVSLTIPQELPRPIKKKAKPKRKRRAPAKKTAAKPKPSRRAKSKTASTKLKTTKKTTKKKPPAKKKQPPLF